MPLRDVAAGVAGIGLALAFIGTGQPPRANAGPGQAAAPVEVSFDGSLSHADYERVIEHPFDVPSGATRLEIDLDYTGRDRKTVLDLGLRGPSGLRGWSGGRATSIHVSTLTASPGYLPGPIEAGRWALVIGVPNIRPESQEMYTARVRIGQGPPVVRHRALRREPGWFGGDLHLHTGHSDARGTSQTGTGIPAPVHRVLDRAREAGLDFVAITDHNTAAHWVDVDRLQPFHDSMLLLHGREITTYRGHANAVGERAFTDFVLPSPAVPLVPMLRRITADGAFLSINHPLRPDNETCMGCGWNDTTDAALQAVHGIEVVNGEDWKGPLYGWPFWVAALNRGHRLTLVGGSDDHTPDNDDDGRAGQPTTVVWARELSEEAIVEGLRRGRTYLRVGGPGGPAIEFTARTPTGVFDIGSELPAPASTPGAPRRATLHVTLTGADDGDVVQWVRRGEVVHEAQVTASGTLQHDVDPRPGDWYSVVVRRESRPTLLTGAIYVASR
jgi:hypothetical protein